MPVGEMHEDSDTFPTGGMAVVVGSSGGIGRALLSRLATQHRFCIALGLGRGSSPSLDLTDDSSVASFGSATWTD